MRLARLLIREAEGGDRGGGGFGVPHALNRREFHLLAVGGVVAGFVAQQHDRKRRGEAKRRRHCNGTAREFNMAVAQQIPSRDAQHEDRGGDIARRHGMNEFRLRHFVEQHGPEIGHLHPHGHWVKFGPHRVLHPAIGDQNPQS